MPSLILALRSVSQFSISDLRLSAITHNKYNRNPEKLRAWKSATHTERAPERTRKENAKSPKP